MTAEQCVAKLIERGYDAFVDEQGLPTLRLNPNEMRKNRKYTKLIAEVGWQRSWGKVLVRWRYMWYRQENIRVGAL